MIHISSRSRSRSARFGAASICLLALGACSGSVGQSTPTQAPSSSPFQTIAAPSALFPGASITGPTGIRGSLVTATVTLAGGATAGAVDDLASGHWSRIDVPGAGSTAAYGPDLTASGYRIVGSFKEPGSQSNRGFIYDSATGRFTALQVPRALCAPRLCNQVIAHSAYGGSSYDVVGNYDALPPPPRTLPEVPAAGHAFLYSSRTRRWRTIDVPHAISTTAYGIWIDGRTVAVAGGYANLSGSHAYVRDVNSGRLLSYDFPGAAITHFEGLTGAGGAGDYNVAGDFVDRGSTQLYGFFLPIRSWIAGTPIVLGALSANSVYARTVVGIMPTGSTVTGYLVNVP